jgi:hypothetical protein
MDLMQSSACLGWPPSPGDPGQGEATIVELLRADGVATVVSRGDGDGDCSGLGALHDAVDVAATNHSVAGSSHSGVAS